MNCKWIETVLALLIIIFVYVQATYSQWIIVLAAAGILIHALTCRTCHVGHHGESMPAKKKR